MTEAELRALSDEELVVEWTEAVAGEQATHDAFMALWAKHEPAPGLESQRLYDLHEAARKRWKAVRSEEHRRSLERRG